MNRRSSIDSYIFSSIQAGSHSIHQVVTFYLIETTFPSTSMVFSRSGREHTLLSVCTSPVTPFTAPPVALCVPLINQRLIHVMVTIRDKEAGLLML